VNGSTRARLSFRRIVDIPFATCVAALDSGQLTGQDRGPRTGPGLVCGPAEHDPDVGTCRIQVRLAQQWRPNVAPYNDLSWIDQGALEIALVHGSAPRQGTLAVECQP
jgi:hypothetical protein